MSNPIAKAKISIDLSFAGLMTLNGLTNGYIAPASDSCGNPPIIIAPYIIGPTNGPTPVVNVCGGKMNTASNGMGGTSISYTGYTDVITYNLPDGGLLTITLAIELDNSGNPSFNETASSAVVSYTNIFSASLSHSSYDADGDGYDVTVTVTY